ncbi:TetR/AcrR family transcriptional regulator [Pontibacter silvestris]|uniref:TetR/AcrR family transcriptional regulator n=1 Tax=Pontibacter silvestris TaxID=2305183 RepID=A0ABW4WUJ6_9BACT|nr:TetR/AcrR family transcriptional regulator [Pontibacter silvestris]MCC9138609.1 TetR/AcrR family transcriptional regulator [Pontibacter silvestris]
MAIPERDEEVIQEIKEAAQVLFRKYGLKKTTMNEIAGALGKGKSTLYYYFKSKDEIYEAVVMDEMHDVFAKVKEAINDAPNAKEKLKAYSVTHIKTVKEKITLKETTGIPICESFEVINKIRKRYDLTEISFIKNLLKEGVESGEFKPLSPNDIDLLAYTVVCSLRGLELPLFVDKGYPDIDLRIEAVVDLILNGIAK